MSMDVPGKAGRRVVFANPESGYKSDQEYAAARLVVGQTYEIDGTDVDAGHTDVWFVGVRGRFNSVMFDDVEEE